MKRLLSLFAVVAIMMSSFSGVVFGAEDMEPANHDADFYIYAEVDNPVVTYHEGFSVAQVTGRILDVYTGMVREVNPTITVWKLAEEGRFEYRSECFEPVEATVTVNDGYFTITLLTESESTGIGTYFIHMEPEMIPAVDGDYYECGTYLDALRIMYEEGSLVVPEYFDVFEKAQFTIMYGIELINMPELVFTFNPESETYILQGNFVNNDLDEDSYSADDVVLAYRHAPSLEYLLMHARYEPIEIARADYLDHSTFGFMLDSADMISTGPIGLYIGGTLAMMGEVVPQDLDVTITPDEIMQHVTFENEELVLTFDYPDSTTEANTEEYIANFYDYLSHLYDEYTDEPPMIDVQEEEMAEVFYMPTIFPEQLISIIDNIGAYITEGDLSVEEIYQMFKDTNLYPELQKAALFAFGLPMAGLGVHLDGLPAPFDYFLYDEDDNTIKLPYLEPIGNLARFAISELINNDSIVPTAGMNDYPEFLDLAVLGQHDMTVAMVAFNQDTIQVVDLIWNMLLDYSPHDEYNERSAEEFTPECMDSLLHILDLAIAAETTVSYEIIEADDYNLTMWNDKNLKADQEEDFFFAQLTLDDFVSGNIPPLFGPPERDVFEIQSEEELNLLDEFRVVRVKDENNFAYPYALEIIFDGCGLEEETFREDVDEYWLFDGEEMTPECLDRFLDGFSITPTETGIIDVTINAYEIPEWYFYDGIGVAIDDGVSQYPGPRPLPMFDDVYGYDPVATFHRELLVEGWNTVVTPKEVVVDSETDVTIVITNEDGTEVNNAVITASFYDDGMFILDREVFDASTTNVVGGVYVIEFDDDLLPFNTVDDVIFEFYLDEINEANWMTWDSLDVVGLDTYAVTSDTAVLLEGFTEEITVTPLDADGEVIYPVMTVTYYDDEDEMIGDAHDFTSTRVDTDDDGVKESIEGDVTPAAGAVKAVVRAESSDKKAYGEVELEVVKPQVVMTKAVNMTAYIETEFEFTVIDPRDGSMLDEPVYFMPHDDNYLRSEYYQVLPPYIQFGGEDYNYRVSCLEDAADNYASLWEKDVTEDDGVYTVTPLTGHVDFDAAEDDENDVYVVLYMNADLEIELRDILVLEATLTSDPDKVIIGSAANLVLTYLDANGNPLEGYDVWLNDMGDIGATDENGQVSYATVATSTTDFVFEAETDRYRRSDVYQASDDYFVGPESSCPIVECVVPVTVDLEAPTAMLEESNGMATITIMDNVRVTKAMVSGDDVDMFYPMPVVTYMTPMAPQYEVQAIDQNYNYLYVMLYSGIKHVHVGRETGYGLAERLNDSIMVPVHYAELLGAVVTEDPAAGTVTYTIDGGTTVIVIENGNQYATVNGAEVMMDEIPYVNGNGTFMVPVRFVGETLGYAVDYLGSDHATLQ